LLQLAAVALNSTASGNPQPGLWQQQHGDWQPQLRYKGDSSSRLFGNSGAPYGLKSTARPHRQTTVTRNGNSIAPQPATTATPTVPTARRAANHSSRVVLPARRPV
jgi:hypothetical protein